MVGKIVSAICTFMAMFFMTIVFLGCVFAIDSNILFTIALMSGICCIFSFIFDRH